MALIVTMRTCRKRVGVPRVVVAVVVVERWILIALIALLTIWITGRGRRVPPVSLPQGRESVRLGVRLGVLVQRSVVGGGRL